MVHSSVRICMACVYMCMRVSVLSTEGIVHEHKTNANQLFSGIRTSNFPREEKEEEE